MSGPQFAPQVGTLYSLFRDVEAAGLSQTSQVLACGVAKDAAAAAALGQPATSPLFRLERLRFAGDEPLAIDLVWLPLPLAEPLLDVDFSRTAIYDELAERCAVHLTGGHERIESVLPDRQATQLLDLEADEAMFRVERCGMVGDDVVEWRITLIRGRRFALTSTLGPMRT